MGGEVRYLGQVQLCFFGIAASFDSTTRTEREKGAYIAWYVRHLATCVVRHSLSRVATARSNTHKYIGLPRLTDDALWVFVMFPQR